MPTYAYACTSCDDRFEVHQSFTDDTLTRCERCDGTLRKLFNSVGIVFKGSGFYRTDSRASNGNGSSSVSPGSPDSSSSSTKSGSSRSDSSKSDSSKSGSSTSGDSGSGSSAAAASASKAASTA